ncbi:MAG TPA: hypothetical protein VF297_00465 [Pyrinomonadaceae bacterium]
MSTLCPDLGAWCACNDVAGIWREESCSCLTYSPVLVDTAGDGFSLTDGAGGVDFDIDSDGVRERMAWTAPGFDDAWLALDGDGDGFIDGGRELFGNYTPQPLGPERNSFLARVRLDYKESKRVDEHGNRFRYRAKVDDAKGAKVNRWAWDVFLTDGR